MLDRVRSLGRRAAAFGGSSLALVGVASAQTTPTFDVTTVTDAITAGVAAVALIGAGFIVFTYTKKIWNRFG